MIGASSPSQYEPDLAVFAVRMRFPGPTQSDVSRGITCGTEATIGIRVGQGNLETRRYNHFIFASYLCLCRDPV